MKFTHMEEDDSFGDKRVICELISWAEARNASESAGVHITVYLCCLHMVDLFTHETIVVLNPVIPLYHCLPASFHLDVFFSRHAHARSNTKPIQMKVSSFRVSDHMQIYNRSAIAYKFAFYSVESVRPVYYRSYCGHIGRYVSIQVDSILLL